MGAYYDKARKLWCARVTDDGHRIFLGRYATKRAAEFAINTYIKHHEALKKMTLDNYKLNFEMPRMVKSRWFERLAAYLTKGKHGKVSK